MSEFEKTNKDYLKILQDRAKKSRVYKSYQSAGLTLAALLGDPKHKSLYMRLSKLYNNEKLIMLAKDVADRKDIKNKGAYFMKAFQTARIKNNKNNK